MAVMYFKEKKKEEPWPFAIPKEVKKMVHWVFLAFAIGPNVFKFFFCEA